MRVLGLISGTSHDGIDGCSVEFDISGTVLSAKILGTSATEYTSGLRSRIINSLPPQSLSFEEVCKLDTDIGQEFAAAASSMITTCGEVDLVSSHGQTMYHLVQENKAIGTTQLGQPAWISAATSASVISDLRIQDIVAGGQGAPLVPVLDLLALSQHQGVVASLNLGGIANITVIRNGSIVTAFDTGPASALIDAVVLKHNLDPSGYDTDGRIAASGKVNRPLLAALLADPYFQEKPPKSTGKEVFHIEYVEKFLAELFLELDPRDIVATLTELTAVTVADALINHQVTALYVAGGGLHNRTMISAIEQKAGVTALSFGEVGIDPDIKEAFAMALIGYLSVHNLPATFTNTTGAKNPPILGRLTPGPNGFRLPGQLASTPVSLVVTLA